MKRIVMLPLLLVLIACTTTVTQQGDVKMIRERNVETVQTFFQLLEQEDIRAFSVLFAEEGKQVNPYHSGLFPAEIVGRSAVYEFWKNVPANFDGMAFPIEKIMPFEDPNMIAAKLIGKIKLKGDGGTYQNDYLCLFQFDEKGNILEYHEYFNPLTAAKGFGLLDKIK